MLPTTDEFFFFVFWLFFFEKKKRGIRYNNNNNKKEGIPPPPSSPPYWAHLFLRLLCVMTIQQVKRLVRPSVEEMLHLMECAAQCHSDAAQDGRRDCAFNPNANITAALLAPLLQRLGYAVLAAEPLDELVSTLETATRSHSAQSSSSSLRAGGTISLRVLYDWLPTIAKLDVCVPGALPSTSFISDVEMNVLKKKLPTERTAEAKEQRSRLFNAFDPNGNGFLSLAEIDKGARDVLELHNLFECKPVLMRAFQAARTSEPPCERNHQGDYVTKRTFRVLLLYLKQYFNLWQLFCRADESGDRRISREEFSAILPQLVSIGLVTPDESRDADALFDAADRDGGGLLLFEEFSSWLLSRGAMQGDDDD